MSDVGKVVWFELWTDDIERTKDVYGELFGWAFNAMTDYDPDYWLIEVDGGSIGAIVAGAPASGTPSQLGVVPYIQVEDLEETIERGSALGLVAVADSTEIPNGSSFAILRDPLGTRIGLWSATHPTPPNVTAGQGLESPASQSADLGHS